jgi:hypothetical protein
MTHIKDYKGQFPVLCKSGHVEALIHSNEGHYVILSCPQVECTVGRHFKIPNIPSWVVADWFEEYEPFPVAEAEPPCKCLSPQLHDNTCAWLAWRRG